VAGDGSHTKSKLELRTCRSINYYGTSHILAAGWPGFFMAFGFSFHVSLLFFGTFALKIEFMVKLFTNVCRQKEATAANSAVTEAAGNNRLT